MKLSSTRLASSPLTVYFLVAGFMIAVIGWAAFQVPIGAYFTGTDYWPHAAAIQEWSAHLANPAHPQIAGGEATSLFVPANLIATLLAAAFNLSTITAMGVAAVLNLSILFGGIYAFGRVYFANRWAPHLVLGVFTLGWGIAVPWSGMVQARGLLFVASYPSTQALGLAWAAIALAVALMRQQLRGWWPYAVLGLLSAVILASHPLSGGLLFMATGLAALTEKSDWRLRAITLGAVASALLMVEAWPWHSFWGIATSQSNITELTVDPQFTNVAQVATALGPLLAGIGAVWLLAHRGQHPLIVLGFSATAPIWLIDRVVTLPLGHRFLHLAAYFLGLAVVAWLLSENSLRITAAWWAAGAAVAFNVVLVALTLGGYVILPVADATSFNWSTEPLFGEMRILTAPLSDGSVVLADPHFADAVPAFAGKVVALSSSDTDGLLPNGADLLADTELFLQPGTSHSIREAIIARRFVTHVLFDSTVLSLGEVARYGPVVATAGDWVMVRVQR